MKHIHFTVPGPCQPKGRPKASAIRFGKFTKINMRTPEKTVTYEAKVYQRLVEKMELTGCQPMDGPLRAIITVYRALPKSLSKKRAEKAICGEIMPTSKPDLDNQVKSILDAIGGTICGNDSSFCVIVAKKRYDDGAGERVDINISEIETEVSQ
jgi:Holliday junction resolvase RusA-like endonuclease